MKLRPPVAPKLKQQGFCGFIGGRAQIVVNITSAAQAVNLWTHPDVASITVPCDVIINLSAKLYGNAGAGGNEATNGVAGSWALRIPASPSGFATGSTFRLNILTGGQIEGGGGGGGGGGALVPPTGFGSSPGLGGDGGDGIFSDFALVISSTGFIFGGAGGGGGGGAASDGPLGAVSNSRGGGGGGGAQSTDATGGGLGGSDFSGGVGTGFGGDNGTGGSSTAGDGGTGHIGFLYGSGSGGKGGDYGQAGNSGSPGATQLVNAAVQNGSAGGQPGLAIRTNGKGVTWLSGNNSTQVKGGTN